MRNKILSISLIFIFLLSLSLIAGEKPNYVGASKCKTCHKADKYGAQFKKWSENKHSKAYEDLKSENAKKKAAAVGIEDPLKDEKCLSCHTTAYGKKNLAKSFKIEEGVSCEACHGPGSSYKKTKVMKDKKAAIAAGMSEPNEATCKSCHKPDTPGHKGKFTTFKEMSAKIAHLVPAESDRRKKEK